MFKSDDHNLVADIGRPGTDHSLLHPPVLLGRVVLARLVCWPARGPARWSGGWSWSTYGRLAGSSPPVGWSCDVRKESCISSHRVAPAARRTWGQNDDQTQKEQKLYHLNMFQISFVDLRKSLTIYIDTTEIRRILSNFVAQLITWVTQPPPKVSSYQVAGGWVETSISEIFLKKTVSCLAASTMVPVH